MTHSLTAAVGTAGTTKERLVAVAVFTTAGWPQTETLLREMCPSGAKPEPVSVMTAPPPAPVTGALLPAAVMPVTVSATVTDHVLAFVLQRKDDKSGTVSKSKWMLRNQPAGTRRGWPCRSPVRYDSITVSNTRDDAQLLQTARCQCT